MLDQVSIVGALWRRLLVPFVIVFVLGAMCGYAAGRAPAVDDRFDRPAVTAPPAPAVGER